MWGSVEVWDNVHGTGGEGQKGHMIFGPWQSRGTNQDKIYLTRDLSRSVVRHGQKHVIFLYGAVTVTATATGEDRTPPPTQVRFRISFD